MYFDIDPWNMCAVQISSVYWIDLETDHCGIEKITISQCARTDTVQRVYPALFIEVFCCIGQYFYFDIEIHKNRRKQSEENLDIPLLSASIVITDEEDFFYRGDIFHLYPLVVIFNPNNIILAQIGTNLCFDQDDIDFAGVAQAVQFTDRNIG